MVEWSPGAIVRHHRNARGWSQEKLGQRCGWTGVYILNLEKGRSPINAERAQKLADALGIEPEEILRGAPPRSAIKREAVQLIDALDDALVESLVPFLRAIANTLSLPSGASADLPSPQVWHWETDAQHRFISADTANKEPGLIDAPDLGATRWELVGSDPDTDPFWAEHRADMDSHRPFRNFTFTRITPNRVICVIRTSGDPTFAPNGDFLGYRGQAVVTPIATLGDARLQGVGDGTKNGGPRGSERNRRRKRSA